MTAPKEILELVERFRTNEEAHSRDYGEAEIRRKFLDPLHVQNEELASLPLPPVNLDSEFFRARYDKLVKIVDCMLDLQKQFHAAKVPQDKTATERSIATTDRHIDKLAYELYGLTEDEIRIVEESVASH